VLSVLLKSIVKNRGRKSSLQCAVCDGGQLVAVSLSGTPDCNSRQTHRIFCLKFCTAFRTVRAASKQYMVQN